MKFTPTKIDGVLLVELERRGDDRGFFARFNCRAELLAAGLDPVDEQGNVSYSANPGTMRGVHWQVGEAAEAKLVRCTAGAIFDVAVDLRPDSPTYRQYVGVELSAANRLSLYIARGCAHGYETLVPDTEVLYLTSAPYTPDAERGMRFDDPAIAIEWPHEVTDVSDKDAAWEPLAGMP